jgi:Flp pilus assembly protein TadD
LFYAYNNQGCFYLQQFLVDEALEELKEARKLKPKHSYALNNYGHGLMLKGELEEGVKLIEEAFRIDRWNYTAMRNIGIYYLLKGDYRGALTVLTKAREGDKHVEDIDLYIALGLKKDGNSEKYNSITSMFSTDQMERLAEITKHIPDGYRH